MILTCLIELTRTFRDFQPLSLRPSQIFQFPHGHAQILPAKAYRGGVQG